MDSYSFRIYSSKQKMSTHHWHRDCDVHERLTRQGKLRITAQEGTLEPRYPGASQKWSDTAPTQIARQYEVETRLASRHTETALTVASRHTDTGSHLNSQSQGSKRRTSPRTRRFCKASRKPHGRERTRMTTNLSMRAHFTPAISREHPPVLSIFPV